MYFKGEKALSDLYKTASRGAYARVRQTSALALLSLMLGAGIGASEI
jgi:hypothetical protein